MSLDKVYLQMLFEEVMPKMDAFMVGMNEFEQQLRKYIRVKRVIPSAVARGSILGEFLNIDNWVEHNGGGYSFKSLKLDPSINLPYNVVVVREEKPGECIVFIRRDVDCRDKQIKRHVPLSALKSPDTFEYKKSLGGLPEENKQWL